MLSEKLRAYKGNINEVQLLVGKINSTRVKFNTFGDKLNSMSISVDDTSAYEVFVEDYQLVAKDAFSCKLRIKIYDNYGLDKADVDKFNWKGFRAWYVLQHVKGYRPFLTCMECVVEVKNHKF